MKDTLMLTPAHHAHIVCVEYVPESLGGTLEAWSILEGDNFIWKDWLNSLPLQEQTRCSAADARFHSCLNVTEIQLNQSCVPCCCFSGGASGAGWWQQRVHTDGPALCTQQSLQAGHAHSSCCRHVNIWLLWYYLLMMAAAATKSNQSTATQSRWWNGTAHWLTHLNAGLYW